MAQTVGTSCRDGVGRDKEAQMSVGPPGGTRDGKDAAREGSCTYVRTRLPEIDGGKDSDLVGDRPAEGGRSTEGT